MSRRSSRSLSAIGSPSASPRQESRKTWGQAGAEGLVGGGGGGGGSPGSVTSMNASGSVKEHAAVKLLLSIEEALTTENDDAPSSISTDTTITPTSTTNTTITTKTTTTYRTSHGHRVSITRYCLELKKQLSYPDVIRNVFLSKTKPNISCLFPISKISEDVSQLQLVCSILEATALFDGKHLKALVRLGVTGALLEFLKQGWTVSASRRDTDKIGKEVDAFLDFAESVLRVLVLTAKHDAKMPVMAWLSHTTPVIIQLTEWVLKVEECQRESVPCLSLCWSVLRELCKNDSNSKLLWASSLKDIIIKKYFTQTETTSLEWSASARLVSACCKSSILAHATDSFVKELFKSSVELLQGSFKEANVLEIKTLLSILTCVVRRDATLMKSGLIELETFWDTLSRIAQMKSLDKCHEQTLALALQAVGGSPLPLLNRDDFEKTRICCPLPTANSTDGAHEILCDIHCSGIHEHISSTKSLSVKTFVCEALPNQLKPEEILQSSRNLLPERTQAVQATLVSQIAALKTRNISGTFPNSIRIVYDAHWSAIAADSPPTSLQFESRFESGNLWRALQISHVEYDLLIDVDINNEFSKNNQWFYFRVMGMQPDIPYRFNIINVSKTSGSFSQGMQPVMFSKNLYEKQRVGWFRFGSNISHHQNQYWKNADAGTDKELEYYGTIQFTAVFPTKEDECYFAYHYPYTHGQLLEYLQRATADRQGIVRMSTLCKTIVGNRCPRLTITNFTDEDVKCKSKQRILLSSRIHPGETNSSWLMHGIIEYLLGDHATSLRENFLFEVVPMLNPDGVVHGSNRCSLAGVDLNRKWKEPSPVLHPTIFHTKALWKHITEAHGAPLLSCDFHGHSRRKNVFFFGCNGNPSGLPELVSGVEKILPFLLTKFTPTDATTNSNGYNIKSGKFSIESSKETTARVVIWRELGIRTSYTCESSFCGADSGPLKDVQFNPYHFASMGEYFCQVLLPFREVLQTFRAIANQADYQSLLKLYPSLEEITSFAGASAGNGLSSEFASPASARPTKTTSRKISRVAVAEPIIKRAQTSDMLRYEGLFESTQNMSLDGESKSSLETS